MGVMLLEKLIKRDFAWSRVGIDNVVISQLPNLKTSVEWAPISRMGNALGLLSP
jgi:hypothetical protein